jgi:hypothetical protein
MALELICLLVVAKKRHGMYSPRKEATKVKGSMVKIPQAAAPDKSIRSRSFQPILASPLFVGDWSRGVATGVPETSASVDGSQGNFSGAAQANVPELGAAFLPKLCSELR